MILYTLTMKTQEKGMDLALIDFNAHAMLHTIKRALVLLLSKRGLE